MTSLKFASILGQHIITGLSRNRHVGADHFAGETVAARFHLFPDKGFEVLAQQDAGVLLHGTAPQR